MVSFKKLAAPMAALSFSLILAGCSTPSLASLSGNTQPTAKYATDVKKLADSTYKSGSNPVININRGKSTLNPMTWKKNEVKYANLDGLNRTSGRNIGYLEGRNVANDELRTEQTFKPTGWHQKFVNGEAIINRGHEIAYSLSKGISINGNYNPSLQSGDQNNPKNLFTQTAWSNQRLQTVYESKVRNALKMGKKVVYEVTPIFHGSDLMAKGVQIQAVSTDKTLNFNVFIWNVQPGIKFNYADGTSKIDRMMAVPALPDSPTFNDNASARATDSQRELPRKHHYFRDAIIAHEVSKHVFHHRW